MTTERLWVGLLIHLIVPLAGLAGYVVLCRRMRQAGTGSSPFTCWFILFLTYGGALLLLLTALFWQWSGMATLGLLYLAVVAPVLAVAIALYLAGKRHTSRFHCGAFYAACLYPCLLVFAFAGMHHYLKDALVPSAHPQSVATTLPA